MDENEKAYRNIETAHSTYEASVVLGREIEERTGKTKEEQERATNEQRKQAARLWVPETILSVLGIETALKALIRREGQKPRNIHDLYCLYKMLAPETQKRICEKAEEIVISPEGGGEVIRAQEVIKEHRKSFVEWRYGESGKNLDVVFKVLQGTLKAVIETYEEKYPGEASKVGKMDTQDKQKEAYLRNVLKPRTAKKAS